MLHYRLTLRLVHGAMGCGQKTFKFGWRYHQLLSGFLAKGYLPRVSLHLRLSAIDRGGNEIIPSAVHRSPGICLTAEKNSWYKSVLLRVLEPCASDMSFMISVLTVWYLLWKVYAFFCFYRSAISIIKYLKHCISQLPIRFIHLISPSFMYSFTPFYSKAI